MRSLIKYFTRQVSMGSATDLDSNTVGYGTRLHDHSHDRDVSKWSQIIPICYQVLMGPSLSAENSPELLSLTEQGTHTEGAIGVGTARCSYTRLTTLNAVGIYVYQ